MARTGIVANLNRWLRTLKSTQNTYFGTNIRLVNRKFFVKVCFHYLLDDVYCEYLGIMRYGRFASSQKYILGTTFKTYYSINYTNLDCSFGYKYPTITLIDRGNYTLTYRESMTTLHVIDWNHNKFKVSKHVAGEGREMKAIMNKKLPMINFDDCFEAVNYMLREAGLIK